MAGCARRVEWVADDGGSARWAIVTVIALAAVVVVLLMMRSGTRVREEAGKRQAEVETGAAAVPAGEISPEEAVVMAEEASSKAVEWFKTRLQKGGYYGPMPHVGLTGLPVWAMAECPQRQRESDGEHMSRAVDFVLSQRQQDGSFLIPEGGLPNYNTSIAVMMLVSLENPKYADAINAARRYLTGGQMDEGEGWEQKDAGYGGWTYGADPYLKKGERGTKKHVPDSSNTFYAISALKAAGLSEDDPAFKKALFFWKRVSNNPEVNDQEWAAVAADSEEYGGAIYRPTGESKAGSFKRAGRQGWKSYGSMTYASLLGFIYSGLDKDSPEAKGALDWIGHNYTLDENPGMKGQGQYYYYHTFAKALSAVGERYVTDGNGVRHDWAVELISKLVELQKPAGSWENPADRWMEGIPELPTAYSLRAISLAHDFLKAYP